LDFFILGVAARSAASLPGIQGNSAILFYQKIRQVINWHLVRESEEMFDGSVELDGSYLGGARKGKKGRGRLIKLLLLASSSVMTRSIRWWLMRMPGQQH